MNEKHPESDPKPCLTKASRGRWHGPQPVVLAIGVNQGDRREALARCCLALQHQGIRPVRTSRIFETRPLAGSEGPAYFNTCLLVETSLMPHELLYRCQGIERAFGRKRERRWAARTLDIDLIVYGHAQIETPKLTLPHPAWRERDFVLWGLRDLDVWIEAASPSVEHSQFDRWLKGAEACILSAQSWPLAGRPREGCAF